MISDPYQYLGIEANATIDEIKKAYRAKALILHPDRNQAPDAQQQFIALTEAYEYVLAERSSRFKRYISPFEQAEKTKEARREEAKRRAREYAQMRYEEFEKTEAAQTINALNTIFNHLLFLFACTLLVAVPFVLAHFYEFTGLVLGLLFLLAIGRPIFGYIKQFVSVSQLWLALMSLVETYFFRIVILSMTNIYLIFKVVMNTMIPLEYSLIGFLGVMLSCYLLLFKERENKVRVFYSLVILPLLINIIFCVNYYLSGKPKIEEYEFKNAQYESRGGHEKSTMIHLEGGKYENYVGIRVFSSLDIMLNCEHIIYQFEEGLLGVRVMKEYRFIP